MYGLPPRPFLGRLARPHLRDNGDAARPGAGCSVPGPGPIPVPGARYRPRPGARCPRHVAGVSSAGGDRAEPGGGWGGGGRAPGEGSEPAWGCTGAARLGEKTPKIETQRPKIEPEPFGERWAQPHKASGH